MSEYINFYECPMCFTEWEDAGDYQEEGECPMCLTKNLLSPYDSVFVHSEVEDE